MPHATSPQRRLRAAVFSPLVDRGKAALVEQRIVRGIAAGVLAQSDKLPSEAEMAAAFGVAPVTAREALVGLRGAGLVETRRGRDGGTYVVLSDVGRLDLLRSHVEAMSLVELRDLAIHHGAIAAAAAELAASHVDPSDVETLRALVDLERPVGTDPARVAGDLLLEVAALSHSARLTREFVRLQAEFGALLSLAHADAAFDTEARLWCLELIDALAARDAVAARALTQRYTVDGLAWLIDEHTRLQEDRHGS